jgi:hypothetical protein
MSMVYQGGYACIRNGTREPDFRQRHFFPALLALIDSDLAVAAGHRDRNCSGRIMRVMQCRRLSPPTGGASLKIPLRADSFLARLSDDDFEQGMAALRTHGDAIDQNDARD